MSRIKVTCDCGKSLYCDESKAGKFGRCPACGSAITIPFSMTDGAMTAPESADEIDIPLINEEAAGPAQNQSRIGAPWSTALLTIMAIVAAIAVWSAVGDRSKSAALQAALDRSEKSVDELKNELAELKRPAIANDAILPDSLGKVMQMFEKLGFVFIDGRPDGIGDFSRCGTAANSTATIHLNSAFRMKSIEFTCQSWGDFAIHTKRLGDWLAESKSESSKIHNGIDFCLQQKNAEQRSVNDGSMTIGYIEHVYCFDSIKIRCSGEPGNKAFVVKISPASSGR